MRFCFLFVIGLVAQVSAYSIPGAYERFLFWYAYKIDGTTAAGAYTIAGGCSKWAAQTQRCNFNQLCDYIAGNNRGTTNVVEDPDIDDLDRWARELPTSATGQYTPQKIMNGGVRLLPTLKPCASLLQLTYSQGPRRCKSLASRRKVHPGSTAIFSGRVQTNHRHLGRQRSPCFSASRVSPKPGIL
jgi:hypothetical protein